MSGKFITVLFIIQITFVYSALPPITKCKTSDKLCMTKAAQIIAPVLATGVPELGIEPLDMMQVDTINVDLAGLKLVVTHANITGLKKAVINEIDMNMETGLVQITYIADVTLKGQYKASGRLLILPINGDGDVLIKLNRIEIVMTMPFKVIMNDKGEEIIDLKSYQYKFDVMENARFLLTNLFNGNKILSDTMLNFMNENWKALSIEFGKPMLDKPMNKIFNAMKTFLRRFPVLEIIEY